MTSYCIPISSSGIPDGALDKQIRDLHLQHGNGDKTAGAPSRRAARQLAHTHAHSHKACLYTLHQRAERTLRLFRTEERQRGEKNPADLTCLG
jgi:hypothetical protein